MDTVTMIAAALVAEGHGGAGPTNPPNSPSLTYDGDSSVLVGWTNGDALAETEIGVSDSKTTEPAGLSTKVAAGVTSWDTDRVETIMSSPLQGDWYWVRHIRNGQRTAWVRTSNAIYTGSAA